MRPVFIVLAVASAFGVVGAQPATPRDTVRYKVTIATRPAGSQLTWTAADGAWRSTFEFNDRGRGPKISERVVLGARGVPTRVEIEGSDYFKNAVNERFSVDGGRASWASEVERGSAPAGGFYSSFNGVPGEIALLARALLAAPGRRLALLPAGEARIEKVGALTLNAAGNDVVVSQYEIDGLGLTPVAIWLDADGRLFAVGGSWQMVIREGFDSAAAEIIKAQDARASKRAAALAQALARRPKGFVVFRNARLFDAETGTVRPRTTVVVTGNRISAVGADGAVRVPGGAEVIDVGGRTLMPGMLDMHTHIGDDDGLLHMAAGITTVRDMANDTDELLVRRKRFDEGTLIGPRVVLAGFMDGPGPYAGPTKVLVSTEDEARAAVNRYADLGHVQIKIYSSIKPELVPAIIDAAHKRGLRVSGHVPANMTAEEVVKLGVDELQHANFLFLNFWGDSVKDTRTPLRFTAPAEKAALLDLESQRVRDFVALLKERGTVIDPTVNIFEGMFTARKGAIDPGYAMVASRFPPQLRRGFLNGGLPVPDGMDQRYRDSFAATLRMVKVMHDAGVTIVPGTDGFPGFAYHRELELYERAGIPAPKVLRMATIDAARVARMDRDIGTIAPGKLADLIIVDGNPDERMSNIRRISLVMKDGRIYDPAALYRAVGVQPVQTTRPAPATR